MKLKLIINCLLHFIPSNKRTKGWFWTFQSSFLDLKFLGSQIRIPESLVTIGLLDCDDDITIGICLNPYGTIIPEMLCQFSKNKFLAITNYLFAFLWAPKKCAAATVVLNAAREEEVLAVWNIVTVWRISRKEVW